MSLTLNILVFLSVPANVTLQKKYYVGREKNVSLDCKVDGYPIPAITWTPCNSQENVCDQSMLNISEVQNDGVYTCTAKNSLGSDSANTSLVIGAKVINVTLTVTNKECNEDYQSFWQKLREAVTDNTFCHLFIDLFI
ncbi:Hemicentin-1 [Porites harrisoni]